MKKNPLSALAIIAATMLSAACQTPTTPDPTPPSAALSDLSIVNGDEGVALSAEFAGGTTVYMARLPNSCETLRVYATPEDVDATVSISVGADSVPVTVTTLVGSTDPIFTGTAAVAVGLNEISVVVAAADGSSRKTYTIGATRVVSGLSDEARLESLSVTANGSPVTLAYEEGKGGLAIYSGSVAATVTSVVITAEARDSNALVYGAGVVALSPGTNYLRLIVTAADGTVQWNFIQIERGVVATLADYVGTWSYKDVTNGADYSVTIGANGSATYGIAYMGWGSVYEGTLAVDVAAGSATMSGSVVRDYYVYAYDADEGTLEYDDYTYRRVSGDTATIAGEWATSNSIYTLSINGDGTLAHAYAGTNPYSGAGTWNAREIAYNRNLDFACSAHLGLAAPTSLLFRFSLEPWKTLAKN